MATTALRPGLWYVSIDTAMSPYVRPFGGPFATEREARDWLLSLPFI